MFWGEQERKSQKNIARTVERKLKFWEKRERDQEQGRRAQRRGFSVEFDPS